MQFYFKGETMMKAKLINLSLEEKIRFLVSNEKNTLGSLEKYVFPKITFSNESVSYTDTDKKIFAFPSDVMLIQSFDDELIEKVFDVKFRNLSCTQNLKYNYISSEDNYTEDSFLFSKFQISKAKAMNENSFFRAIDGEVNDLNWINYFYFIDKIFFKKFNTVLCYSKEQYDKYKKLPYIQYIIGNSSKFEEIEYYLQNGVLFSCYTGKDYEELISYLLKKTGIESLNNKDRKSISVSQIDLMIDKIFTIFEETKNKKENNILEENTDIYLRSCLDSIVLLKDEKRLLPLKREKKVSIIGDFFSNKEYIEEICNHQCSSKITGDEIINNYYNINYVGFAHGYLKEKNIENLISFSAIDLVQKSDLAVIYLRANDGIISNDQLDLVNKMIETKKDLIVVLDADNYVSIPFYDKVSTILYVAGGGEKVHDAILNVLSGEKCPSGRITKKWNVSNSIELPFGYGLSYGNLEYSNLEVNNKVVSFNILNISNEICISVPQLYIRLNDKSSSFYKPQLRGYKKVSISPEKMIKVEFELDDSFFKEYDFKRNCMIIKKGVFELLIGNNIDDICLKSQIEKSEEVENGSEKSLIKENISADSSIIENRLDNKKSKRISKKEIIIPGLLFLYFIGATIFLCLSLKSDKNIMFLCLFCGSTISFICLIFFLVFLILYFKRRKNNDDTIVNFLLSAPDFNIISKREFEVLNQKEESFVNEENIEEIGDNQLINKEDIKLDKNTSLSKEEIELHEEELKKLIEEKNNSIFEKVDIKDKIDFDSKSSLVQLTENLKKIFLSKGLIVELSTIRSLISAIVSTKIIILDSKVKELFPIFFDSLKEFLGFESHAITASDDWSSSFNLCWNKNDENNYVITDFITDIYCASKLKNNICFSVINEVNMENVDMYLKEILEYASSPNLKHTIKVNKQIDLTIPKNMLFIIVPKSNDFINKIPAKLSQYSTIIHLLMREEKKIPLNEDISCLSYSYLHSLVDDYKNDFYLSENNWKKIDSFISCLNLKENIELSNKCSLRIEDYVTTYMASGGDEFQALEAVGQEILLPYVSFLDYFKDNKNYSSFIELTNNCFGEEANEILRYFKIQEVSEV